MEKPTKVEVGQRWRVMHTTVFKDGVPGDESDVRIYHNSDWSGEAILHWHGGLMEVDSVSINGEHRIPGWVARELCHRGGQ